MRLKTAVVTAVVAGSLAGPAVVNASAATRSHTHGVKAASKAKSRPADDTTPGGDPVGVLESVITEIEFDLSGGNLTAITWDFPGFGPYGTL
jgi:hypothetical protein